MTTHSTHETLKPSKPPIIPNLTSFSAIHKVYQDRFRPDSPETELLVQQLALLHHKLEQIPQIEAELELNSSLTLAEHFTQNKPTPLARLWNLHLRLLGRFTALLRKLQPLLQNEPTPATPPSTPILQNKPSSSAQKLLQAIHALPIPR